MSGHDILGVPHWLSGLFDLSVIVTILLVLRFMGAF